MSLGALCLLCFALGVLLGIPVGWLLPRRAVEHRQPAPPTVLKVPTVPGAGRHSRDRGNPRAPRGAA